MKMFFATDIHGSEICWKKFLNAAAFYNAWFLDHDSGAVYFNVLNNGIPFLLGTERQKGSHSMSGYHSFELCYLAATYTNLLVTVESFTGILTIALFTGIIFARFSRPFARVLFSNVAVVAPFDGVPTLMFRVANQQADIVPLGRKG